MLKGVNWIAVVAAVVLLEVLGYVWYAHLFEARWTAALGATPDPSRANLMMGLGVITTAISVLGLAWLIRQLGVASVGRAVGVALAAWFFFNFTTMAIEYLYLGHKAELVLINMAYQIVAYVVAAIVLALFKPKPAAA
jgi:hypothetical protein